METAQLCENELSDIGWALSSSVREIDRRCDRFLNGRELGLCNIKSQLALDVAEGLTPAPPRTVREEDAISWWIAQRLENNHCIKDVDLWRTYEGTRNTCDLVVPLATGGELWLELKLAWKQWFNTTGEIGKSGSYRSYLLGSEHRSHSLVDDFVKLDELAPVGSHLGVFLVGFDSAREPIQADLQAVNSRIHELGWSLMHSFWQDRRHTDCRINVWFWSCPSYRRLSRGS